MKKKMLIIISALAVMVLMLCSCDIMDTFDAGKIKVDFPRGWYAYSVTTSGETNEYAAKVYKGAEEEMDVYTSPGLEIQYILGETDGSTPESEKEYMRNVKVQDDISTGDYTWSYYTGTKLGAEFAVLWRTDDNGTWYVKAELEQDGKAISIEDEDVCKILDSVRLK